MKRTTIGLDIAKQVFQAHAVDPETGEVTRTKLRRAELSAHFAQLAPALVVMEACGSAQHWARQFAKLGHEVKLIAAQFVRPFVKTRDGHAREQLSFVDYFNATSSDSMYDMKKGRTPQPNLSLLCGNENYCRFPFRRRGLRAGRYLCPSDKDDRLHPIGAERKSALFAWLPYYYLRTKTVFSNASKSICDRRPSWSVSNLSNTWIRSGIFLASSRLMKPS